MRTQLCCAIAAIALLTGAYFSATAAEPVDLNHATVAELMRMPGMTEVWARRIVKFRPYRTKLDLLNEGVITAEVYARIRDSVVAHRSRDNH
jgi:DNA uptake protein ComE-like DNA-binding protein